MAREAIVESETGKIVDFAALPPALMEYFTNGHGGYTLTENQAARFLIQADPMGEYRAEHPELGVSPALIVVTI